MNFPPLVFGINHICQDIVGEGSKLNGNSMKGWEICKVSLTLHCIEDHLVYWSFENSVIVNKKYFKCLFLKNFYKKMAWCNILKPVRIEKVFFSMGKKVGQTPKILIWFQKRLNYFTFHCSAELDFRQETFHQSFWLTTGGGVYIDCLWFHQGKSTAVLINDWRWSVHWMSMISSERKLTPSPYSPYIRMYRQFRKCYSKRLQCEHVWCIYTLLTLWCHSGLDPSRFSFVWKFQKWVIVYRGAWFNWTY